MDAPELEYRMKYQPDYTGMLVTELPFAELEDHAGRRESYCLDLIVDENRPARPLPVVIFVHGGGFLKPNNKRQAYISRFARAFTQAGLAVVSPDYPQFEDAEQMERAGGEPAGYGRAAEAIHLTYRFLAERASGLGLDASRIAIIGGSAGGWTAFHAIAAYPDRYRLFINCWGVPGRLPPLTSFPPTLSVHGTADALVPYAREAAAQEALERAGIRHRLISLEGSGHTPLDRMGEFLPVILEWLAREMQ